MIGQGAGPRSILLLDIGSGTQDVLLHMAGERVENCPKFVLPSPARMVAGRIRELTAAGRGVYVYGENMGGGFGGALREHARAGLPAAAHPEAAAALADDPERVRGMGVALTERAPAGFVPVWSGDYDAGFWRAFLGAAGLPYPELVAAAAQDHGLHPGGSNRIGRFEIWRRLLGEEGMGVDAMLFAEPLAELTRLRTLQRAIGGGPVADTGGAAVLGALYEAEVQEASRDRGALVVNVGNSHAIAFLVWRDHVYGVYEHHTGLLSREKLVEDLDAFRRGTLRMEQVMEERGHGCAAISPNALGSEAPDYGRMFVLGPRRDLLAGEGRHPAPGGDMMLAGCFGLLRGLEMMGYSLSD